MRVLFCSLIAVVTLSACKTVNPNDSSVKDQVELGEVQGYENVDVAVKQVLFIENGPYYEVQIHKSVTPEVVKLEENLGAFAEISQYHTYLNGTPNPLTTYLWTKVMANLATRIADDCPSLVAGKDDFVLPQFTDAGPADPPQTTLTFKPEIASLLGSMCAGKGDPAALYAALLPGVDGEDKSLKGEWLKAYYATDEWRSKAPGHLKQVLYETLLNPYVMLRYK